MGQFIFVSLSLLVVALSLSGVKGCCCPDDWLSRNGFCYKVNDQLKTWNDAEMLCRKFKPGCHLASIHSMEEGADLAEYISDYMKSDGNVWIGLNDPQKASFLGSVAFSIPEKCLMMYKEGKFSWNRDQFLKRIWEWSDRSSTDYFAWNSGEPNNQHNKEYCVELLAKTGFLKWNDVPCESVHPFLCQCRL